MKSFIAPAYTFTTGASGVGTVNLSGISGFNIKYLVSIINQTKGQIIYVTGTTAYKYTNVTGTTVTLFYDTTSMSSGDILQVIYEDLSPISVTLTGSTNKYPRHIVVNDSAINNIPSSASLPLQIVASTSTAISEIQWTDEIGEIIGVYTGASGVETLIGLFAFGGGTPLAVNIPASTRVSIRNMKSVAITSGNATIQLIG